MAERNLRKTRIGRVVSNKIDKTITVAIEDHVKHPFRSFWEAGLSPTKSGRRCRPPSAARKPTAHPIRRPIYKAHIHGDG